MSGGAPHRAIALHRAKAWSLAGVSLVMVVGTAVLVVLNGLTLGDVVVDESIATICVLGATFAVVGGVLTARLPRNPIGWILGLVALLQMAIVSAEQYATFALLTRPDALPFGEVASWLKEWIWAPGLGLAVVMLPLLYPTGRPPSPRWWFVAGVGGLAVLGICLAGAITLWPHRGVVLMSEGGEAEYVLTPQVTRLVDNVGFPILAGAAAAALVSLIVRFRSAGDRERRQILWVAVAAALTLVFMIAYQVVPDGGAAQLVTVGLGLITAPSIPLAIGVAILRHRLYDLDLILDRTLLWVGLATLVVVFYVSVVGSLDALMQSDDDAIVSLVATAVVAVAFAPVRDRMQRGVNHLVYGERDDPYGVLSRLGERLEAALEPRAVLPAVADAVASALKLPYVAIEVVQGNARRTAAEAGRPVGEVERLPLVFGSETVGALVVAPRAPGERFGAADRRLLADLARQIGVAVHAARLTDDLQRSRERLVLAREEERRRLRRDLHDGLGPSLSSAMLKIAAARRQLPDETPADDVLREVRDDLRTMVADIRSVAHGLRPPSLDQLGLVAALEEYAAVGMDAATDGHPLSVAVTTPEALPPLPAAVEVAAYLIAREALTNAARHSQGHSAVVHLGVSEPNGSTLLLAVTDDGHGIPVGHRAGVGLTSMKERAEELGGALTVESSASGTRVLARLPMGT